MIRPKVKAATAAAIAVSAVLALLDWASATFELSEGVAGLIVALSAFLGGYAKRDTSNERWGPPT